jgi:hypothetical protein
LTPPVAPDRYKNDRFPAAIISHGVWLYYRFCLSYRDAEELLFARGIIVTGVGRDDGHGAGCVKAESV